MADRCISGDCKSDRLLGHPAGLDVIVIDPDTVSKTNVGRQNFWPSDVGQSKAEILVNRCNMLMQTGWVAEAAKVTDGTQFSNPDIVIGCVDNRNGRKTKLFWGKISGRASTSRHFLRIGFLIIPVVSNAYCLIRPIYAIFRFTSVRLKIE